MTDTIRLTLPPDARFRGVATMVIGGVGSRLDLPYARIDDLQLAVGSVLEAVSLSGPVSLEIVVGVDRVSVSLGPFPSGDSTEAGLLRMLDRLVDTARPISRNDAVWLELELEREAAPDPAR